MINVLSSVEIRKATIDDIDGILRLIEEFYNESLSQYGLSFSCETLINTVTYFINNHIALIAVKDGNIVGTIGGVVQPSMFDSKQLIAQEAIWYVNKAERFGTIGIRLLKQFEKECSKKGANFISMIFMSNLLTDKLNDFYSQCGYKLLECHCLKGV